MFRLHILSAFTLFEILSGCRNNVVGPAQNDPFSTLPADSIIGSFAQIESKVFFSFTEYINPTDRTVSLMFHTERSYSMAGYRIESNVARTGNTINARLDSIQAPEGSAAIFSPATATFNLGVLPNDLYSMNISMNGKNVPALMLLSDTSFITRVQPNNLLATSRPRLLRVPKKVIWGQTEAVSPATYYQLFLDSLVILGATPADLLLGDYGYFTIKSDGSFDLHSVLGSPGKFFLYQFDPDISVSRALVKRFAKRYQDSVYIQLLGGRGEMYYTTVLKWEP